MDDHVLDLQVYANSVTSRHLGKEWQYGEIRKTGKNNSTIQRTPSEPNLPNETDSPLRTTTHEAELG